MKITRLSTGVLLSIIQGGIAAAGQTSPPQVQATPAPAISLGDLRLPEKEILTPTEARMDSTLRELMRAYKRGGDAAADAVARQKAVSLQDRKVAVRIQAKTQRDLAGLRRRLTRLGGRVTTTFQANLYGLVPVAGLETMATAAKVLRIEADLPLATPDQLKPNLSLPDPKNPGKK